MARSRLPKLRPRALTVVLAGLAGLACGAEFDPVSEIDALRVLAVQKDAPYARPGESVELRMLWHDGVPDADREITRFWVAGCFNPPGDSYFRCFETLAGAGVGSPPDTLPQGVTIGAGDTFSFEMPENVIRDRPPPNNPRQPRYGLAIVFFAACAGTLEVRSTESSDSLPLACTDDAGEPLGPTDFVVGYTSVYAYESITNANAVIDGFRIGGAEIEREAVCIGGECLEQEPAPGAEPECPDDPRCVAACPDDGESTCPEIGIEPLVDEASAERDSVALQAFDRDQGEQMWINYYVDRGALSSEVKLLNDAVTGWNPDYHTNLFAPEEPGPLVIWAVVHDNRGGVEWARLTAFVH